LLKQRGFSRGENKEKKEKLVRGLTRGILLENIDSSKPGRDTEVIYKLFRYN
jgi:hypothetical protein